MTITVPNPYHQQSGPNISWTRVNSAESALGVQTPLSLTFWDSGGEAGFRVAYLTMGLIGKAGLVVPESIDLQCTGYFYGQQAVNIDLFREILAAMPGADSVEQGVFSTGGGKSSVGATKWRKLRTRLKLPLSAISLPRRLRKLRTKSEQFWSQATQPGASPEKAKENLAEALRRFPEAVGEQVVAGTVAGIYYGRVVEILAKVGRSDIELKMIGGYGKMSEIQLTKDLVRIAREGGDLKVFLAQHGFHGPAEGEMSSPSWREDPEPVARMLTRFKALPEASSPEASEKKQLQERQEAEQLTLNALSGIDKLKARFLLARARHYIPLRVEAKAAFMQMFDVARCAARTIGDDWVKRGLIDDREDIFFLTVDEILEKQPPSLKETVAERRRLRKEYESFDLPLTWTGMPERTESANEVNEALANSTELSTITGIGGSFGVAEGIARVIIDPTDPDALGPDEILVCHVTDPSWSALFFVATAVVIDIGGTLSHGAIVARELGIPCVINTLNGTHAIHSGDRVRVDGQAGTVEILERA